ncbi:MAG TPA: hypothetical protein VKT49_04325 [Bryobacteraceae bacterium]|nr:hypothetical protein [Bryobacteraceae bacterium]
MRCVLCGREFWLPARMRRDPDFCSPAHREKYNHGIDLALRRIQEPPALLLANTMPVRVAAFATTTALPIESLD